MAVIGVVVGIVFVGVALATILVQITGSVASNEFIPITTTTLTTTTTIPSGEGLQAAISTRSDDCNFALNDDSTDRGAISFDLNTGQATPNGQFLCVRNIGPGDITTLTVAAVTTTRSWLHPPTPWPSASTSPGRVPVLRRLRSITDP